LYAAPAGGTARDGLRTLERRAAALPGARGARVNSTSSSSTAHATPGGFLCWQQRC